MFLKTAILTSVQLLIIYLFALEQNFRFDMVIFPFSLVMVLLAVSYTFLKTGYDVKREGMRVWGTVAFKDKPEKNAGPYKLTLFNSFFMSSVCVMFLGIIITFL
ncbi:hypothetical protein [Virgibacillus doumboii]|uniref:hypothetical protein n=1 Tax=Virgibacillus doumboii TaxID=2697503 RepID=UPI0013DF28A9|nr:hypothetical protein [Virgibacillus doumboii]